jgi:hypothetical protein
MSNDQDDNKDFFHDYVLNVVHKYAPYQNIGLRQ